MTRLLPAALALLALAACATAPKPAPPSQALSTSASGPLRVACADWKLNHDGSWSARRPTPVDGQGSLAIDQKDVLLDTVVIRGRDLVVDLSAQCPHVLGPPSWAHLG